MMCDVGTVRGSERASFHVHSSFDMLSDLSKRGDVLLPSSWDFSGLARTLFNPKAEPSGNFLNPDSQINVKPGHPCLSLPFHSRAVRGELKVQKSMDRMTMDTSQSLKPDSHHLHTLLKSFIQTPPVKEFPGLPAPSGY
jgi:hypothetical protein